MLKLGAPGAIGAHLGIGLVCLAVCFGMFAAGWMGGGDAKLLAASALWIGPEGILAFGVLVAFFGGALALALLSARSVLVPVTGFAATDRLLTKGTGVPYGIAIAGAGFVVYSNGPMLGAALAWL